MNCQKKILVSFLLVKLCHIERRTRAADIQNRAAATAFGLKGDEVREGC